MFLRCDGARDHPARSVRGRHNVAGAAADGVFEYPARLGQPIGDAPRRQESESSVHRCTEGRLPHDADGDVSSLQSAAGTPALGRGLPRLGTPLVLDGEHEEGAGGAAQRSGRWSHVTDSPGLTATPGAVYTLSVTCTCWSAAAAGATENAARATAKRARSPLSRRKRRGSGRYARIIGSGAGGHGRLDPAP